MPGVDLSVVGRWNPPVTYDYTFKEVVLYALGVGAGVNLPVLAPVDSRNSQGFEGHPEMVPASR
jgi:Na+-transporting NADH:ubiquinone oxidoreductase subunit NqrE